MKKGLTGVLAATLLLGCIHQAMGQQKTSGALPTLLEYEGVLTASDERAETLTIDTGAGKVVLTFTESTAIKARSKNSAGLRYESRGGVLLSITLARIVVGDRVHITCEPTKAGSGTVCRKMDVEVSGPPTQNHTRLIPRAPSVVSNEMPTGV